MRHHSTIVCTISKAPVDLLYAARHSEYREPTKDGYLDVNVYQVRGCFMDQSVADVMLKIVAALNTDNHDRSDSMTDYFDVGHHVTLRIGRWDRPFRHADREIALGQEN